MTLNFSSSHLCRGSPPSADFMWCWGLSPGHARQARYQVNYILCTNRQDSKDSFTMPPQHFINTNYTLARRVCCFINHDNSSINEEMLPFSYRLYNYFLKTINKHSLETVQLSRVLTILPQDTDLMPSTYMATQSYLVPGNAVSSSELQGQQVHI